jgi:hypothetical protein
MVGGGSGIIWYTASSNGSAYAGTEALTSGTYYASQTVNSVESTTRLAVTATVHANPTPTFTAQPAAPVNLHADETYTTQSGHTNYQWGIPGTLNTDYSITSGGGTTDNTVVLKWLTPGYKSVTINYTTNGCAATSPVSSNSIEAGKVGDSYAGGKIGYLFVSGDPGYVSGQVHGLVVWNTDESAAVWGCNETLISGTSLLIGQGSSNTGKIESGCATPGIAARRCTAHGAGWYLPSEGELLKIELSASTLGLTNGDSYWSSSESSSNLAYDVQIGSTVSHTSDKTDSNKSRAVRTF